MIKRVCSLLLMAALVAAATPAFSQPAAKRPLSHDDYNLWRSIQSPTLSPDGAYVAYSVGPQEGDGEFVVRHLPSGKEHRHPRGARAAPAAAGARGRGAAAAATPSPFSPDGKRALFLIYPSRGGDRTKGKAGGVSSLGILDLASGKVEKIDRVRAFTLPEDGPPVVAYQRGTAPAEADDGDEAPKGGKGKGGFGGPKGAAARPATPGDLVLRDLTTGQERTFPDVTEYSLTRDGKLLVYAVAGKKDDASGVWAVAPTAEAVPVAVRTGGRCSRLTWDEKQTQLVFFHSKPAADAKTPAEVRLAHWKRPAAVSASALLTPSAALAGLSLIALQAGTPGATDLTPAGKAEWQPNMRISDQAALSFSQDGNSVWFSLQAAPPASTPAATAASDKAAPELWHYKDDYIQPQQKVRYSGRPNYRAVFHISDRTTRQLADETLSQVQPAAAGDWALALDERPYRILVGSQAVGTPADVYLLNSRTGEKKLVARNQPNPPSFSPGGKYLLSFDGKDWHSVAVADGKRVNLTAKLGVSFVNETHDQPSSAPPHGVAGWTGGDTHALLYDRYDIWLVAADGSSAKNVTRGLGRKNTTVLRLVRPDGRERAFDVNQPQLVRAENEATRDTGFYRVSLAGGEPKLLVMGARNYGTPTRAKKGDRYLFTVSTFYDFPDLYTSDLDFKEIVRVSDANPRKAEFNWGKAELIGYKTLDGQPLRGVLIKPENFDPSKKYPMIVYIYERLTQNLHRFTPPSAGTSINPTYYASNGYLVLMPDIAYTVGYPGQSAIKCVLPAIQAVVDQGIVDESAIGIQGHSWGGYQTAYLITQTTRFKAAAAGAPVSNMTSAYGGIRWESGLPRQFQYEKTQSRIGATPWQALSRFVENSPLFYADRIQTPLLMLHNDGDGAVPWQQGIEYYLALRRLGKEVYLFNYPGEGHGLRQRPNQRDYTVRMQQFFDHHLKGAAKPEWMAKGIPYTPRPGDATRRGGRGAAPPAGAAAPGTSEPE
jgi:dipeptidyl aminopeptidase/acylaminoacyl peptidase